MRVKALKFFGSKAVFSSLAFIEERLIVENSAIKEAPPKRRPNVAVGLHDDDVLARFEDS